MVLLSRHHVCLLFEYPDEKQISLFTQVLLFSTELLCILFKMKGLKFMPVFVWRYPIALKHFNIALSILTLATRLAVVLTRPVCNQALKFRHASKRDYVSLKVSH